MPDPEEARRLIHVVVHKAGGYDRLVLESEPDPVPGEGEVAVAVEVIGVNYADCVARMGLYAAARAYVRGPLTPGFELAGRVAETGAGVSDLEPGDAVLGITRFGAYASRVVVPRRLLFAVPASLTMAEAAALPVNFLTAWYALNELAVVRAGSTVLVHSAAGGVGGALLQLGRLAGCRMIGVVGESHKVDVARSLGAEAVIDRSREPLWRRAEEIAPAGYDVILDANGAATLRAGYRHLAPGGKLVVYGFHGMLPRSGGRPDWLRLAWNYLRMPRFNPLWMTSSNRSVLAFNLAFLFHRGDLLGGAMERILRLAEERRIVPPPIRAYPLAEVADAHRALESGETVGKLVLLP